MNPGKKPVLAAEAAPVASLQITSCCTGCGACVSACPERALSLHGEYPDGRGRKLAVASSARCTRCGACLPSCPREALFIDTHKSGQFP